MLWLGPWSEGIKKRVCRYLLQRYLGQFLQQKLKLDQLSVNLYSGTGQVSELCLDTETLNQLGEAQGLPFEFVDGFIQQIDISIPWATLLKDDSFVQINGLTLTVQPKLRPENGASMLESLYSMSSSMQLAAECLKQETESDTPPQPYEGIERFAQTIDSILSRAKVKFCNTVIRVEHVPKDSVNGVALELHIKSIDYVDEAGNDSTTDTLNSEQDKTFLISTFTTKKISLDGITLYTNEFLRNSRSLLKSVVNDLRDDDDNEDSLYKSAVPDDDLSEENPPESNDQHNPQDLILFARISGRQEIRIKVRQSDDAIGPKVDFQLTLGSITSILSPRQFHVLSELINGMISPQLEDNATAEKPLNRLESKPMQKLDFERVEAQLTDKLAGKPGISALNKHGWSTAVIDDSDQEDEKFLPMTTKSDNIMMDSCTSIDTMSSSITSNASSLASSNPASSKGSVFRRKKAMPHVEEDPNAETTHLHIRIASFALVLLHEDILTHSTNGLNLSLTSIAKMKSIAENFFSNLGIYAISGYGSNDMDNTDEVFNSAIAHNHLRLIIAPIIMEGNEKSNSQGVSVNGHLTMAKVNLQECLYVSELNNDQKSKIEVINIMNFKKDDEIPVVNSDDETYAEPQVNRLPNVKISFSNVKKMVKTFGELKYAYPKTDVKVAFDQCTAEIDITIVDRMSAILYSQPICKVDDMFNTYHVDQIDKNFQSDFSTEIKLTCPLVNLKLRFPKLDLRPSHDMTKIPWWQRSIRDDYLLGTFKKVSITNSSNHKKNYTDIKIQSKEFDLFYMDLKNNLEVHVGRATNDTTFNEDNIVDEWPTMTINILPTAKTEDSLKDFKFTRCEYENFNQPSRQATSIFVMDKVNSNTTNPTNSNQPSPFSSKMTVHESETPHSNENKDDTEELLIPGDKTELSEFSEISMRNSNLQIKCSFPIVSLQLVSQQIYEILYNRINSDLLLWEPSAPSVYKTQYNFQEIPSNVFQMCKNNANYNSDTESSTSSENTEIYHSVYDQKAKYSYKPKYTEESEPSDPQELMNNLCLQLDIKKGLLSMFTPAKNNSNQILPTQRGEIDLSIVGLSMCYVGGIGGDNRYGLMSLQAVDVQLFHCGLIPRPLEVPPLRIYGSPNPQYMKRTIYHSDKKMSTKTIENKNREMLSLAINIKPDPEHSGYKVIKIATGIYNATLQHIMTNSSRTWLNQILDMMNVEDYEIPGYIPSVVVTELHVHIWDCAIIYKPIHLPMTTAITIGSFSISSNVVAQTKTSNLRFIAEECSLFLSEESNDANKHNLDIKHDFVCIIDVDLFEISMRLNDLQIDSVPKQDLRAFNNVVHIRTCSDSFKNLCRLINYVACDGDFNEADANESASNLSTSFNDPNDLDEENVLISFSEKPREEIRDLSQSQVQHFNDMMAEAIAEKIGNDLDGSNDLDNECVKMFFFPDEFKTNLEQIDPSVKGSKDSIPNMDQNAEKSTPAPIVSKELGDFNNPPQKRESNDGKSMKLTYKSSGDTDDEYCFLGEDIAALKTKTIEPEIRWLTDEPINYIENHFAVPTGKADLLKPPKNFPPPVLRYTLCEMTLIWHMYGGNDFKVPSNDKNNPADKNQKKTVTINDAKHSPTPYHRDPYNLLSKTSPTQMYGIQRGIQNQTSMGYNKSNECLTHLTSKPGMPGSPKQMHWKQRGGPGRRHDVLMELQLNKIKFQHEMYPSDRTEASRQVLIISSIEIRDKLASSQINKFLYQYSSEQRPLRKNANMLIIKAVHLRPDPNLTAQECCLKISLLPLRFNIDQDALLFIINFFRQLNDGETQRENSMSSANSGSNQSLHSIGGSSRHSTPTHQPPIMSVNTGSQSSLKSNSRRASDASKTGTDADVMVTSDCLSEDALSIKEEDEVFQNELNMYETTQLVSEISENLIRLEEDMNLDANRATYSEKTSRSSKERTTTIDPNDDAPIYFRSVVFSPDVPIRLDYNGRRIDLSQGPFTGLLMGLGQLNCSELRLKSLSHRHGLLGFDRLAKWIMQEWINDIKRHQLPGLLGGFGPMHSFVQLFQGVRDLFWLPIEQYQRDGRLVRGLQRGASSFTTSTCMAALDITAKIIHLIQLTAETAYDMVSPSPGLRGNRTKGRKRRNRARQPQDIREGVTNAYHLVKEGLGETAQAIADVATKERASRGYSGAVGGMLRQIPPTALAPVLLASEAATHVLDGVRATLAPANHRDHKDKWKVPIDSKTEYHLDPDAFSDG